MPTIESVRAIKDPGKRATQAAKIIRAARARADEARQERDAAAMSLHRHYNWGPVDVYRAIGVSRSAFVDIAERVGRIGKISNAEQVMSRAAATVARNETLANEAREVRDEAATGMLNGRYRKPGGGAYRNSEVAKCTGLTTARVAQLRQGRR
jgi:hypothetical protein